jgi:hypothetical protein
MKKILTTLLLTCTCYAANAQDTIPDISFTLCSGGAGRNTHYILDNDHVLMLVWMQYYSPTPKMAYNIWQQFESTDPGKVVIYFIDPSAVGDCGSISKWVKDSVTTDGKVGISDNYGNTLDENYFGGHGDGHIVIAGGRDHKVYWNEKDAAANTAPELYSTTQWALDNVLSVNDTKTQVQFTMQPNPVVDILSVTSKKPIRSVLVSSVSGQIVANQVYNSNVTKAEVDFKNLPAGIYSAKVTDINGQTSIQKVVKQ